MDGKTQTIKMNGVDNQKLVTVLMPVHNGEKYLKDAIDSILSQSYTDFEFIIIDDASTDGTWSLLKSYNDPRIILVKNDVNVGLTKSLNIGLKMARGKYVARIDADDIATPERLKIQKEFLDKNLEITAVGAGTEIINDEGKIVGKKSFTNDPELIKFFILTSNQIAHPTAMYRKSIVLEKCGGYNENFKYVQDYELWSRLVETGCSITNLPQILLKYRYHPESITQAPNSKHDAYKLVTEVIRKNLLRYTTFTNDEFEIFLQTWHHRKVESLKHAIIAIKFWSRLERVYTQKEKVSAENIAHIHEYIRSKQTRILQWYIKKRFDFAYRIFTKIWKRL